MIPTVAFTVTDRPEYLKKSLESWSAVRGVENWRMVFCIEPTDAVQVMTNAIREFRHPNKQLLFNQERLGALRNPYHAMEVSLDASEFVVLAEDDCLVSSDILEYFSWARDAFQNHMDVLGVCANSKMSYLDGWDPRAVRKESRFCPSIWGTWRDRWKLILGPTWDHDYSSGDEECESSGWDWNINKRIVTRLEKTFVFPEASRSDHIGKFQGTHMIPQDFPESQAESFQLDRPQVTYRLT
jgi:hypothetical protein